MRDIRRRTRKQYSAEEKIRIVLEGLRGEDSIAELCRREGLNTNVYYRWSKEFLEAGKKRLSGDIVRKATSDEVKELRSETAALREALAEAVTEIACLKKACMGDGEDSIWDTPPLRSTRLSSWWSSPVCLFGKRSGGWIPSLNLLQLAEALL